MSLRFTAVAAAAMLLPSVALAQTASPAPSYTLTSPTYTQNFDTLASTGTSNALPAGFQIVEGSTGSAADGMYAAGTGSSNAGNTYSFGASGSSERALGSLTSGSVTPIMFGGVFTNGLATAITALTFGYVGEQWRLADATTDRLAFSYSVNASSLTNGTWTAVSALDFLPLFTNGPSAGMALDGNAAANQRIISSTISGLSIASGSNFGFRWTDLDVTGSDQGLAVDNLSISAATGTTVAAPTPEPATWAMLIIGFGLAGMLMRRRRGRTERFMPA